MKYQYQLRQIRFSYADKIILDIKQQNFMAGKITALLGTNGTGKSTLIHLLAFVLPIQTGEIEFSGECVNYKDITRFRKRIGLVQQNPYLIKGNVSKNILFSLKFHGTSPAESKQRIQNMLHSLKIEHLAERSVRSLSGGEIQKVAIARALVLSPEVILLDEPFTHLDSNFTEEFEQLILKLSNEDKTIIFTTHNQSQAEKLSDRILNISNGELLEIYQ